MSRNWEISRRTFLRGVGTAVALPLLDAMAPSIARAAGPALAETGTGATPNRMAVLFVANGTIKDVWTPLIEGSGFDLPASLESLKPVKDDLMVMTGLAQNKGNDSIAGDHARGTSVFLTGSHPKFTNGSDIQVGISADQLAAQKVGHLTRLPSLELGTKPSRVAGNCDSGYSCAYTSNIAWRSPTTPMAKEINPKYVFERLFGNGDPAEAKQSLAERDGDKKSILDLVMDDAKELQGKLGKKDQEKLDEYLYSVRQVEQRAAAAPIYSKSGKLLKMAKPEGIPEDYGDHVRLMCDLMVLAFQGDVTRISTFMLGLAGDNRPYKEIGVPEGHHDLSHHGGDPEKIAKLRRIDKYNVSLYAYFIERLKAVKEGNGSLLDHCMVMYGSELGDGNRHSHNDLPVLLAGKGGGAFQTGRHIRYAQDTPLNNLYLAMMDRIGASVPAFGDSTGRLNKLTG